jgi:nitrate reductase cytochrome c-type subunit
MTATRSTGRGAREARARTSALLAAALAAACASGGDDATRLAARPAAERAALRAYDGAPPVIPHPPLGAACRACHTGAGLHVVGLGFAPPSPHGATPGLSAESRCEQCHVFRTTGAVLVASAFAGLPQEMRGGSRLYPGAPPVLPHPVFMREDCLACHGGPAARAEIRCSHPERAHCLQCHVEAATAAAFRR